MQELPIIQSLWIGDKLSTMERLCISSFLQNGHPFHLYVYGKVKDIPKGVIVKDANEIVQSNMIFKYKNRDTYAGFSDIFRYKLLLDKGGYWVDTDNVCLQPFTNDAKYVFSSERPKQPDGDTLQVTNCGIIKAPKGSEIMQYCYKESISKDQDKIKWGEMGPKLIASAVKKFGLSSYVAKPEEFCPIDWWNWDQFISGSTDKSIINKSQAVHLWNEMWRINKVNKESLFDENSIYEWLKKKYLDVHVPKIKLQSSLTSKQIDSIRDGALSIEKQNLKLAYDLMSIAHEARPTGKFIKKKLDQYKQDLDDE